MSLLFVSIALSVSSIGLTLAYLIWRRDRGFHRLTNGQLGILGGFAAIGAICCVGAFL